MQLIKFIMGLVSPMKAYWAIAGTAIIAGLVGVWKYRGFKVEKLEAEVSAKDKELEVSIKVNENTKDVAVFEAKNEVTATTIKETIDERIIPEPIAGTHITL